ncbi:MAG: hypothetical protein MJE77_16220 [Proteobacteria bacterium]|nr:hypothetical protein [Pseudomonadota bacterium]
MSDLLTYLKVLSGRHEVLDNEDLLDMVERTPVARAHIGAEALSELTYSTDVVKQTFLALQSRLCAPQSASGTIPLAGLGGGR